MVLPVVVRVAGGGVRFRSIHAGSGAYCSSKAWSFHLISGQTSLSITLTEKCTARMEDLSGIRELVLQEFAVAAVAAKAGIGCWALAGFRCMIVKRHGQRKHACMITDDHT